ncbi:MAG: MMPL family transporter [Lactobacillus sp.]|jgi:RND superfamily putative drug exporter|nr:MMPL family transporter [Lactobacillus sp.]
MEKFRQKHILPLIVWIVLILIAIFTLPDVSAVTRAHSGITLPKDVQSQVAQTIEKKAADGKNVRSLIAVFNNKGGKISSVDTEQINDRIKDLRQDKNLQIQSITAPGDNATTKKKLTSDDGTTKMAMITLKSQGSVRKQTDTILKAIKTPGLRTYVTGNDILNDDFSTVTQEGLKKTEVIAAIFIFFVLVVVFRSPIVPLISISTVAVAFLISLNIVMNLAETMNFPISNFTQVFLVVVLFGIGTDYNILLYDRFKEELSSGAETSVAAKAARRSAGRTILYSGTSVLIGFTVLALAKFSLYRSGVGVAVGVAVLLLVLLTLNMFFMSTLGPNMFWPSTNMDGSSSSKLWHWLSKITLKHTYVMIGIIAVLAIPILLIPQHNLNFNDADELPSSVQSKKGYEVIQAHFPAGMSGPSTLYIQSKHALNTQKDLAAIDDLTNYLKQEKGVKTVSSATQPGGTEIKQLYLKSQLNTLVAGLNQASTGLKQVQTGLNQANSQLSGANVAGSTAQVQQLASGTSTLQSGAQNLSQGINTYTAGVSQLASGTNQLSASTPALTNGVNQLNTSSQQLASGMAQLQQQASSLSALAQQLQAAQMSSAASGLTALGGGINQLASGTNALSSGIGQLQGQLPGLNSGVAQLNAGAQQLNNNSSTLVSGGSQVASGSAQVNSGVQAMSIKMQALGTQVTQLQSGLTNATNALGQIDNGTGTIKQYLQGMGGSYMGDTFYIPKDNIQSKTFKPALDTYMSKDRKIANIMVVLKGDPSTTASADQMRTIKRDIKAKLKNTSLQDAKVAMGGQTSQTADLQDLSNGDFVRTAAIMLIGISVALLFVTRSVIQDLTIIGTLIVTYISALNITRWLSSLILGRDMLTWNTPFFGFIMLVALGVDYSIFLMTRYRGDASAIPDVRQRILSAATVIGAVVISAAIILGGTFAALIPSGVITLIQVAMVVMVGLLILVFALPIVMSAMVKWTYPYVKDKMYQKAQDVKNAALKPQSKTKK